LKLSLPVVGPILKKLILARLAGFFAMMYSSGITIIDCIRTAEEISGNKAIEGAMRTVGQQIADGKNLSDSFEATGLFPPLVLRMIRVGETTGALEESLENVAYFYTRDVRESIERLQALIEPTMTVVLGVIVGWVMFSVLGPIYDLITKIEI
jgi:type IV pilus assembly protein PilC